MRKIGSRWEAYIAGREWESNGGERGQMMDAAHETLSFDPRFVVAVGMVAFCVVAYAFVAIDGFSWLGF